MTENERLDLRVLDAADDKSRTDALVRSVMAQVERRPRADDLRELRRYRSVLAAAAAVFACIALLSTLARSRRAEIQPVDVIAQWARDGHVPTNAELLAAYQGYRQ
jgi:hypothetical protein